MIIWLRPGELGGGAEEQWGRGRGQMGEGEGTGGGEGGAAGCWEREGERRGGGEEDIP